MKFCTTIYSVLLILASLRPCTGYKILVAFPFPTKSHSILGYGYVKLLLNAGHEVTYITPFPEKNPNPKLRQIDIRFVASFFEDNEFTISNILNNNVDKLKTLKIMLSIPDLQTRIIESDQMQNFLNDPKEHFDVVIVEWMFSEFFNGLGAVFNAPFIWSSSVDPHSLILTLIDDVTNPAYIPNIMSGNVPPFTFTERVTKLIYEKLMYFLKHVYLFNDDKEYYNKYFGPIAAKRGLELPPYEELKYNVSLILANTHVSTSLALPMPQSCKPIGGYHIDLIVKPLPENIQKLMDGAKYGVIYFSMGSNLKSKDFPNKMKQELLSIFGNLQQTVIWKFEEDLPNTPKNVHILKWAPQQSILSHPNCVLFITHGGLLSTTEAVHFGVPTIGIPVYGDQFNNVKRAVKKGYAMKVDFTYSLANDLQEAIKEALSNPKYKEKIEELFQIYHDRPIPPGRELVHWVEHVVKTGGAPHLRSPVLMVPWYQKMFLDLILVILALFGSIIIIVKYVSFSCKILKIKEKLS